MGQKPTSGEKIEIDENSLKIEFIKSFTSSELTVGNREITTIENSGAFLGLEQGNFKNQVFFKFNKLKELCDDINKNNFCSIQAKKGKFVTSGSDKGNSIIITCGERRFEVRNSERGGLTKKEQDLYLEIEKKIIDFTQESISSFTKITVTLDDSIYKKYDQKYPISINLSGKNILILTSKVEGKIENLRFQNPKNQVVISPWSVLGDEPEDKNDILKLDEYEFTSGKSYLFKLENDKIVIENI